MTINSDIRDQAYQFFVEEARELLQVLESGLLALRQERSVAKVHELMRAAHSIKGGAAGVGLDTIKSLAHRLEDIFNALYSQKIEIDTRLESWLLEAYDCLRDPLLEQIELGYFDAEKYTAIADRVFGQIEERLGDALTESKHYVPDSTDLGVDVVGSIFEIDVAQGLDRLSQVLCDPQSYEVAGELTAQAEVFAGFAELLNLPGFGQIARTALTAIKVNPDRALEIIAMTIADCQVARIEVLSGDRSKGGSPSAELMELAIPPIQNTNLFERGGVFIEIEEHSSVLANSQSDNALSARLQELNEEFGVEDWGNDIFSDVARDLVASDRAWNELSSSEAVEIEPPSLEEIFAAGDRAEIPIPEIPFPAIEEPDPVRILNASEPEIEEIDAIFEDFPTPGHEFVPPATIEATVQSIEEIFDRLPSIDNITEIVSKPEVKFQEAKSKALDILPIQPGYIEKAVGGELAALKKEKKEKSALKPVQSRQSKPSGLSMRVDLERLDRMNNLVGELAINRNSLSLQNDQMQGIVREMLNRFGQFKEMASRLQEISDQMLIAPESYGHKGAARGRDRNPNKQTDSQKAGSGYGDFDSLEMDNYGKINSVLQGLIEEMVQFEEAVDEIVLFSRQSNQTIERQRQMLTYLRDELMWARMLPLGEVLNRFPRVMRDLSTKYNKPVNLKISGTGVLVDKAVLEKLYDPLSHLLRNAFDHGIEPPELRRQQGKPEEGVIEILAYHQGNQTIIEIKDDGQGIHLEKIVRRAVELGLIAEDKIASTPKARLLDFIFRPGFSTAAQVTDLSGRGMGLDAVRLQLQALKGSVTVASSSGKGAIFTLRLPLTLTISKLLVCSVASAAIALPSDSIEEILIPKEEQIKKSGTKEFLSWRDRIVPIYRVGQLLEYNCPLPDAPTSDSLTTVPTPEDWAAPLLLLRQGQQIFAIEVDRIVTEQELVIKPFGAAIVPPAYIYGCTIMGDGSLVPVINANVLLLQSLGQTSETDTVTSSGFSNLAENKSVAPFKIQTIGKAAPVPAVLVVDDSAALRRTLALTLQQAGYRVLQARDGQEALEQLRQGSKVNLIVCDIEMPNMNGFEFLTVRRQAPELVKIPIAMLTSRGSEKHRQLAMQLGATAYFTKPYIEVEFLAALKSLVNN